MDLHASTNLNIANDVRLITRSRRLTPGGTYEGLEVYRDDPGIIHFLGGADDAFVQAICHDPIHPGSQCRFQFEVSEKIWGIARFADFRVHGGRTFANRGVRFAREVVCRYLEQC